MPPSRSPSPPTKRLIQELRNYITNPLPFLQHLGPKNEDQLFEWEAVMQGPQGTAYEAGLWHLTISIPTTYPLSPPTVTFDTRIIHPNISFQSGEICLDLLKAKQEGGWTPAYTIARTLEAIWLMLRYPEVDSPLNVDVAVLLRTGDAVAAEGLVRWGCGEWRWKG
ncbi:MAG: hypothetical protein LQ338_004524 [Usnochroma carphineum]|nr:MAG: hypothetical protein LQ338_004524 [Usnochroma carphineum]